MVLGDGAFDEVQRTINKAIEFLRNDQVEVAQCMALLAIAQALADLNEHGVTTYPS